MTRIYKTPFAATGDKETLADTDPGTGKVSLVSGWTPDYEKPNTDPDYRPVGRAEMNGVINEITEAVGELQLNGGFPAWRAIDGGWPMLSMVLVDDSFYVSVEDNNTTEPEAVGSLWEPLLFPPQSHQHTLSDIVDAGTAAAIDVMTSQTDLTPNRALVRGSFGLGLNGVPLPAGTNLDLLRSWSGFASITTADAATISGLPVVKGGGLQIIAGERPNGVSQIFTTSDNERYFRTYNNSSSLWSLWVRVATSTDIAALPDIENLLDTHVNGDDWVYPAAKPRTTVIAPVGNGVGWQQSHAEAISIKATTVSSTIAIPFNHALPAGAVLTGIEVSVAPGLARANVAERIQVRGAFATWGAPGASYDYLFPTKTDDGSTTLQTIDSGLLSRTITGQDLLYLFVRSGSTPSTTIKDSIYSIRISWTDPGPRNY